MLARCIALVGAVGALVACQPEAVVTLDCPSEPGQRVQVALVRRVAYSIHGDCPERDDCVPSRELWTYTSVDGAGDVRFYESGLIRESVSYGYQWFDAFCCPDQGVFVVGISPGTVRLTVDVTMAVDGESASYSDSCELPVVVWDLQRVP